MTAHEIATKQMMDRLYAVLWRFNETLDREAAEAEAAKLAAQ